MKTPLPVLSCEGCGQCCTGLGSPPGYAIFFPPPGHEPWLDLISGDDLARLRSMPDSLRQELAAYYAGIESGEVVEREGAGLGCLWYDHDARRCRHHDWRPDICRDFEVGDDACLRYRRSIGLPT